ncbi:MAG: MMPL family transporter [Planctomycetota bacterium]
MRSVLRTLSEHPRAVCLAALLSAVAALAGAWQGLSITTDRLELIGGEHAYLRHYKALREAFPDLEAVVVVAAAPERSRAEAALADLGARLRARPDMFEGVFHGVDPEAWVGKAVLFLELGELRRIDRQLQGSAPSLAALARRGLGAFLASTAERVDEALASANADADVDVSADDLRFLHQLCHNCAATLRGEASYVAPWSAWLTQREAFSGAIVTRDGRVVLLARPTARGGAEREAQVGVLRELVAATRRDFPEVELGVTGNPVLEVDELHTFRRDAWVASLVSFLGIAALLMAVQRRIALPLLLVASVGIAVAWTLGLATLWPGRLNLISLGFCVFLVSLGVDYGLHIALRWWESQELSEGVHNPRAEALGHTARAIFAGAVTTALAFLATLFSDVQGIREFGGLAALGTMLCLVVSLGVLPALLRAAPHPPPRGWTPPLARWLDGRLLRMPRAVALGCAALAVLGAALGARGLRYEANLLALQSSEQASARLAREVLADDAVAGMFAACVVRDRARLEQVEAELAALPEVARCESISSVLPREQPEKLALLSTIGRRLELPTAAPQADGPLQAAAGARRLRDALEPALDAALGHVDPADLDALGALLDGLDALIQALEDPAQAAAFGRYQEALRRDLRAALLRLARECRATPIVVADLPQEVRERFVAADGKLLLRIYPLGDPWDPDQLETFLRAVQGVVADVSGVPVQLHESDLLLRKGTRRTLELSCAFVVFFLLLHFRSARHVLTVLAILAVGLAWAVGTLSLIQASVGPPHLIALPLVIGIAVDFAIHLVERHRESNHAGEDRALWATSTGRALYLSSLTTCFGFAVLGVCAHHPGLSSVAWCCCAGVAACYVSASVFAPALLRWIDGPPPRYGAKA